MKKIKEHLPGIIDAKCRKKEEAREARRRPIVFGLGMFGVVGWTVAIPAVAGIFIGRWLDGRYLGGTRISWTLSCFFGGLLLGILLAWNWIHKE